MGLPPPSNAVSLSPAADKLYRFVVHITFLALWKSVSALGAPFGRVLAFYLWSYKSIVKFVAEIQRLVCRTLGWLSEPAFPRHSWLRALNRTYLPLDLKRWQIGLGTSRCPAAPGRSDPGLTRWRGCSGDRRDQLDIQADSELEGSA
jgi:hypothetical protein